MIMLKEQIQFILLTFSVWKYLLVSYFVCHVSIHINPSNITLLQNIICKRRDWMVYLIHATFCAVCTNSIWLRFMSVLHIIKTRKICCCFNFIALYYYRKFDCESLIYCLFSVQPCYKNALVICSHYGLIKIHINLLYLWQKCKHTVNMLMSTCAYRL